MSTCFCDTPGTAVSTATLPPTAQELWQRYHRQADSVTENALVEQYLNLVVSVLGRLAMTLPEHVSRDDLHSAGLLGLLQALRNYDPTCGSSFETYARVRIRGAMLDELRRMDWVPRTIHEKARKIHDTMAQLEQELGRTPAETQMAKALGISVAEYTELLNEIRPATFVCLDTVGSTDEGDTGSLYEVIADTTEANPVDRVSQRELKQLIFQRLKEMPKVQQQVLALYYMEDMRLHEIAKVFGLTESRICQIHSQAILSIRAYVQRFEAGMANSESVRGRKA